MIKLNIVELTQQWAEKTVDVSRPTTPEEKKLYGSDQFGGIFEECFFIQEPGQLLICGADGIAQVLTEDTVIQEA